MKRRGDGGENDDDENLDQDVDEEDELEGEECFGSVGSSSGFDSKQFEFVKDYIMP